MEVNFRKGFYFSFDAFLALAVMSASLFVVAQSSGQSFGKFKANQISYKKSGLAGQDAMKLASVQRFRSFNETFRQELVDETVMEEEDLNRTILDGISLLWAARNFSYAEEVTRRYFDSRLPDEYEYRLQVNEDGNRTIIYRTSDLPQNARSVSSVSRLVSGHKIDRPSEGYQARARATSVTKNTTKIISIPAMGAANENGKMEIRKEFRLPDVEEIHHAYFYINEEYNGDTMFEQVMINGKQVKNQYTVLDKFNDDTVYARWDMTEEVREGNNSVYMRFKGDASQDEPTELQPGTKMEIKYRKEGFSAPLSKVRHERFYLEDLVSDNPGSSESGIFKVESFGVPKGAEFINASLHLNASGFTEGCGYDGGFFEPDFNWDVQIFFNGNKIEESCATGSYTFDYSVPRDKIKNGTNIFTIYLENKGNYFWGGSLTEINSDFQSSKSSHIDLWYNVSPDSLKYGKIRVSASNQVGGVAANPKSFEKQFNGSDLETTQLYMVERYSNEVEVSVDDGSGEETVFRSPDVRATPTEVRIPSEFYDENGLNTVEMYDYYKQKVGEEGSEDDVAESGDEDLIKFLPYSTFKWTVWAPSQVGYGSLFSNQSAALKDARQRLEKKMGPFVDATGVDTGTLSTGNQPYLWGPASVKLVVWK